MSDFQYLTGSDIKEIARAAYAEEAFELLDKAITDGETSWEHVAYNARTVMANALEKIRIEHDIKIEDITPDSAAASGYITGFAFGVATGMIAAQNNRMNNGSRRE